MANRPSSPRPNSGRGNAPAGGRRRTPPPVKKPFPWGVVALSTVLGLLLAGILVYAVKNQGAGFVDPLSKADKSVSGVKKYKEVRTHVDGAVNYDRTPPAGGKHNAVPQTCAVYAVPIASEHAVHSLEHGAVWVTYRPDLPADEVNKLKSKVEGSQLRLLSPFPGLQSKISLQAWGRQVFVDSASDKRVDAFLDAYTQGPQAPERGSCEGTRDTGPLKQTAPATTVTVPPTSTAPSAGASPK